MEVIMRKICFLILSLCVTLASFGQAMESEAPKSEVSTSRAWYLLRQWNAGPLLLGLTQQLGKVIESSQRNDFMWTGTEQGGSLKLNIAVEDDVTGEIFIGLFKDPNWTSAPVQVRSFSGPGEYIIKNLPAGKFQIGAMTGSLPVATSLGVQQAWPEPIEIERGKTNPVKVLVSCDFQKRASGWYNKDVSRDFVGDWKNMNPDNLLQGQLTGPEGRPIAFAEIMIREHNPGTRRGIRAPNRGTNEQGYYKYDGINWPYKVTAVWRDLMPSVLSYRYQQMYLNRVLEGPQTVDFKFGDFPAGAVTLTGRVSDQNGNPLSEFFIAARTQFDWTEKLKNPDGKYYNVVGYRASFISEDGNFKLDNLPEGDFTVRVIPFNISAYEFNRGEDIKLEVEKAAIVNLEVVSKNVLYGRILFRDGSPAVVKPTPWQGAKTSILLTMDSRARSAAELDDEGYFAVNLSDREVEMLKSGASRLIINVPTSEDRRRKSMGDFPFEKLSEDKSKAGILKIERPDRKPLLLIGKPLPEFKGIDIDFDAEQAKGKMILVCFFGMEQRPSRNCLMQLTNQAEQLKEKEIIVVAIHAAKVGQVKLNEWIKENKITFPVGIIAGQEEQIHFNWGVKSLPWLILTDKEHNVAAEGFSVNELDDKI